MKIKVILADDHMVVREGLKAILESDPGGIEVMAEASNGSELLHLAKRMAADVYIIDIAMPVLNGLEGAKRLLKKNKNCKIIILSMYDNRSMVEEAMKLGVMGYVLKESAPEEIITAIREVSQGRYFLSPKISKYVVQGFLGRRQQRPTGKNLIRLTPREKEVLQLISEGFSNKAVAQKLRRSVNTVHVHRNRIMQKLDIHNQAGLVRYALKEGISHL
jgi:DNA-binding NarL/FixJ family response regulator